MDPVKYWFNWWPQTKPLQWRMILNKWLFPSQVYSFWVELCHKLTVLKPFYAKYAKICSNYLKMSGFPSRNVRYPRYQDTNFLQLEKLKIDGPARIMLKNHEFFLWLLPFIHSPMIICRMIFFWDLEQACVEASLSRKPHL